MGLTSVRRINYKYGQVPSLGTQPPELEDRDGEQNEALLIHGEMVRDLLHHLDTHKLWSWMGSTEEAGRSAHQATLNHLSAVLAK